MFNSIIIKTSSVLRAASWKQLRSMCTQIFIHLFVHFHNCLSFCSGVGELEPIPANTERKQDTTRTSLQFIAGLTCKDKQSFRLTFCAKKICQKIHKRSFWKKDMKLTKCLIVSFHVTTLKQEAKYKCITQKRLFQLLHETNQHPFPGYKCVFSFVF